MSVIQIEEARAALETNEIKSKSKKTRQRLLPIAIGLAAARARGRNGGRKPKMTPAKLRLAQAAVGKRGTVVADL